MIKYLVEKGDPDLKSRHLKMVQEKRQKRLNRSLKIDTVSVDLPKKQTMTLHMKTGKMTSVPFVEASKKKIEKKADKNVKNQATEVSNTTSNLMQTIKMQENSINQILGALNGLSDFKKDVSSQIKSISKKFQDIKGRCS